MCRVELSLLFFLFHLSFLFACCFFCLLVLCYHIMWWIKMNIYNNRQRNSQPRATKETIIRVKAVFIVHARVWHGQLHGLLVSILRRQRPCIFLLWYYDPPPSSISRVTVLIAVKYCLSVRPSVCLSAYECVRPCYSILTCHYKQYSRLYDAITIATCKFCVYRMCRGSVQLYYRRLKKKLWSYFVSHSIVTFSHCRLCSYSNQWVDVQRLQHFHHLTCLCGDAAFCRSR